MPYLGQDWRSPGEAWVKTTEGWEQAKLRPVRTGSDVSLDTKLRSRSESDSSAELPFAIDGNYSNEENSDVVEEIDDWQPHCFVKTAKSKEFIGCTSMSEAFQKLDLTRMACNVRCFNYVCKVVQILVQDKLQNLSGSARKILLSLVEAIVIRSLENYCELNTIRMLCQDFLAGLTGTIHHYGSPKLLSQHQDAVSNLSQLLESVKLETPADSSEDALTFLDLPQECLRAILKRLPDHDSLLTAAKAHEALNTLVSSEHSLWKDLCYFHFSERQIDQIVEKLRRRSRYSSSPLFSFAAVTTKECESISFADQANSISGVDELPSSCPSFMLKSLSCIKSNSEMLNFANGDWEASTNRSVNWRKVYFELKKFFGLREVYADMIHICCYCKALFWKGVGHPCIAKEPAPSVRVTPSQFIEMISV